MALEALLGRYLTGPARVPISTFGYILVLAFAVTGPWATYRYVPGTTLLIPVALGLLLTVTLAASIVLKMRPIAWLPVALLLVFCSLVVSSVIWTIHREVWFQLAAWWLVCFLVFFGCLQFVRGERRLVGLALVCAAGALITLPLLSQDAYLHVAPEYRRFTVAGHNANHTGYVLAASAFIIISALRLLAVSNRVRLTLVVGLILIGIELVMLGTRGAQISVILTVFAAFVVPWISPGLRLGGAATLFAAAVLVPIGVLSPILAWVDVLSGRGTGDLSGRFPLWNDALGWIGQFPWLGIGPGSFPTVSQLRMEAHNQFLNVLLTVGWIGMAIFVALLASIVWAITSRSKREGSAVCLLLACFYIPVASSGHIDLIAPMWLAVAFAICLAKNVNPSDNVSLSSPPLSREAHPPIPVARR